MTLENHHTERLITELSSQPAEAEWFEFKTNLKNPEEIGEYISALSNSAALLGLPNCYLVWGIENNSHKIVGTKFKPFTEKVGAQDLQMWLSQKLTPKPDFQFLESVIEGKRLIVLAIQTIWYQPVRFQGKAFIRVGSHKSELKNYPEKERKLWTLGASFDFEKQLTKENLELSQLVDLLDFDAFGEMIGDQNYLFDSMKNASLIVEQETGFGITNLGALLFARDLNAFENIRRKAVRVVVYQGKTRTKTKLETVGQKGYALGFSGLVRFILEQVREETVSDALRADVKHYPELAIRELVANAIIHQDLTMRGTSPMVEIFTDRIEITNPGMPLIDVLRFIDGRQSRNEIMAATMRSLNICEERGSGIDKVITEVEAAHLPPPEFEASESHTKAVLLKTRTLKQMSKLDKIRGCYQHACLCFVNREEMTNASLRQRFDIPDKNYATISRIISETVEMGWIKPDATVGASRKHARYLPFWAQHSV